MIWQLLVVCSLLWMLKWRIQNRKLFRLSKQLQCSVPCLPVLGHGYKFIGNDEDKMKTFQEFGMEALRQGGITHMWLVHYLFVVIADPEAAEFCLKNYLEKGQILDSVREVMGNGSFSAPVPIWRPRRKILVPTFSPKNIQQFARVFAEQASIMVDKLSVKADKGPFSIWEYFTTYTMDSVGETTLGVKLNTQNNHEHEFIKGFELGTQLMTARLTRPWLQNQLVFRLTPAYKQLEGLKEYLYKFIGDIIQSKRKEIYARNKNIEENFESKSMGSVRTKPLLELLIESSGSENGYDDVQLREELQIVVMAGNDTSAVGASFITLMLSRHPEVQEKVYQELYSIFGTSQRLVAHEDIHQMKYLDAVIRETLRLYPPGPVFIRESDHDLTLPSGVTIPAGCVLLMNIWAIHRNPQYWGADAEEFRPERWLGDPLKHPAQFIPFSLGPRNCVGYQYAMSSMKIVLSTLLRRYRVLPAEEPTGTPPRHKPIRLKYDIMMKDVDNYLVKLHDRGV